ncbi:MAG: glutathione S-transferase family protein, partial [Kangiellaceae bacterium]|nr:glutathione S-transferase family protein [Kangiellaceae bacterium]
ACPWAHRTLIYRKLKSLEDFISVSVVEYGMYENGWEFSDKLPDHLYNKSYLYEIYTMADANYSGRVTVPILWDKQTQTIVSNESSEIIRMLNSAFDDIGANKIDLYPASLTKAIDLINERVYSDINNGVYKVGFATEQDVYEDNLVTLFDALDWVESILSNSRYLVGEHITEADWRLFTTLVRFDPVYVGHFKCNLKRIFDYPNIFNYLKDLYQQEGIADTVNMEHIKKHYYMSHRSINPTGIVPTGPTIDLDSPHDRVSLNNKT